MSILTKSMLVAVLSVGVWYAVVVIVGKLTMQPEPHEFVCQQLDPTQNIIICEPKP